jgi:hypothetical protein
MRIMLELHTWDSILIFELRIWRWNWYFRIRPTKYVRSPNTNKRFSYGYYKWTE